MQLYVWHCPSGRGVQTGTVSGTTIKEVPNCAAGQGAYQLVEVDSLSYSRPIVWDDVIWASAAAIVMWGAGVGIGLMINVAKRARF